MRPPRGRSVPPRRPPIRPELRPDRARVRGRRAARLLGRALHRLLGLALDGVPSIQVDWALYGPKLAQVALLFGADDPPAVGPVRSARHYFVAWAAEWQAVYVHVGGSPQALDLLRRSGRGQLVYDADEFRYGGRYLWRIDERSPPHNVYTDGEHLRALAKVVGAKDEPRRPVWRFEPDAPIADRPVGGTIEVPYPANRVRYAYDRLTNTYRRSVTGERSQVDAATGEVVAPKNVVVLFVRFAPLDDGSTKHRLEAQVTGSGVAYVATNGTVTKGTWRKRRIDAPLELLDRSGRPIPLTVGQTFVQVVPTGTPVRFVPGSPAPPRPRAVGSPIAT